ncbi:MAG: dihydrofolate reductase family protein [Gallionella sp.]
MSIKASVFIATSLDGFIARKDGALDWLPGSDGNSDGEDFGYREFMASVDTLVIGRNTYDLVLSFGAWPYAGKQVIVLSSRYPAEFQSLAENVEGTSLAPHALVKLLDARGARNLYVDGGKTIQAFLRAGLIDEMIIARIPVLLGDGISLFGGLKQDVPLGHRSTRAYQNGIVQSRYEVVRH